jgi:hypothetical protein
MASHPVTVTASYDAGHAPDDTADRLKTWASGGDGRTFTIDRSIAPTRWTVTADYIVDADNPQAAERIAADLFRGDTAAAGIVPAETVLAATGPLG